MNNIKRIRPRSFELPDFEEVKDRDDSVFGKVRHELPDGDEGWIKGWIVSGTMPGTDIPTLDVFRIEDDNVHRDIVKVEDVFNVDVWIENDE